ncbi:sensor domain-containing protein [Thalassobacillus hwangdonensis]|uniref:EAL domain-containing protein n=1 Tax=Thalassobacillus hwangdonensis TaxID=546108 RepID=A0ABW3L5M2_9BACI
MTILNLDTVFDREKISSLIHSLEDEANNQATQLKIEELKKLIHTYISTYHDLKYALDQSTTITVTDKNGVITYVDNHFCTLSNYERSELIGRNHRMLKSAHHEEAFFQEMWETILSGKVWYGDVCNRNKHGETFWLKTTIVPLLDESDKPHSFIAFRTDITESKRMEGQLIDAMKNDFRRTVNAMVNLIFKVEVDQEGEYYFTLFEGKLAHELGLTTEKVQGRKLKEIFAPEKVAFLKDKYERAFNNQEINYKHKYNGKHIYTTLSPIMEQGEMIEVIGSSVDITVHEEAELRVRHMAYHDALTDLPNRRKLQLDLERALKQVNHTQGQVTVMFCDLDRFKYINDALGHKAGDQVLQTMAERLSEVIGYYGEIYRIGGDEFMIVMNHTLTVEEIRELGNDMLHSIGQPIMLMGKEFFISASIGVAQYPEGGDTPEKLIGNADIAMHYCKMNGRHGLLFYTDQMNEYYNDLVSLEGDLREAISKNELELYYQPKVDIISGQISGMEALVRWHHYEKGFIPPNKFIPLAEETGLIVQVGEWVLKEACRQNEEWMSLGYAPERVAVNVSAVELQRHDFSARVKRILEETGMPPQHLEIEITENSIMQNTEECIKTMQELKAMGISLSIDDFGTGYSSLGYLRKFPINFLKIDQSFIKDVETDPSDAEIVKAMIQLGHTFQMEVVAEGVETASILEFLEEIGCDLYQGYHYSRPLPPHEFEKMLMPKRRYEVSAPASVPSPKLEK